MFTVDLTGKTGLVMGVTNQRSIAWQIARPLADAGARLAFSYQGERLRPTLEKLTSDLDAPLLATCDVTDDADLDALFERIRAEFGRLDFVVHAVAYAPTETFANPFSQTSREDWRTAMDVSAYSLVAVANRAAPLMPDEGGSIVTLSYLAAERVVPHYNMMGVAKAALEASTRFLAYDLGPRGIRVNALSAGPLRTVAARSIAGFGDMYGEAGKLSMLKRNITGEEVGRMGFALLTDLAGGVTGETVHVDAGFHAIGMFLGAEDDGGDDAGGEASAEGSAA
ncbi:MAG: enoyl-ACP reductase [Trueperaceae bacterium]|nr:enoyl-ACP reductase [Trueperaceae bacterium]